jgi:predicted Rossmann-fold nucleotide-binding protein
VHLGLHHKPCALLDVAGFYSGLARFLDHVEAEGFLREGVRDMLLVERDPAQLLAAMRAWRAPPLPAQLTRAET